jgi:2-C-methyl-D-erythritol 4-phosphate cytidylyltransferase
MNSAVIVLAAGRGERLGGNTPKAFVELGGKSLLERALDALLAFPGFGRVQPVVSAADLGRYAALGLPSDPRLAQPVFGGAERQDSVAAGLAALPSEFDLVGIHDAARCRVDPGDVAEVVAAAEHYGAAILAAPVRDTLKRVNDEGVVISTLDRRGRWQAQTPQVFHRTLYAEALEKAQSDGFLGTDDAQLVERIGSEVHVVPGSPGNFKITLPEDLALAKRMLDDEEFVR